ncbi:MAG: Panacea domain-containing protein [Cyanobacteria bacterium]|nr:Panacea domain-containing protein [Cyanobacteriota bacterium]
MSKLADVVTYLCAHYPHKHELSKARLTKLVYLADWTSAQEQGNQITDIKWFFHNYGPYVDDVIEAANLDPRIKIEEATTIYGAPKVLLSLNPEAKISVHLSPIETKTLDKVINETKALFWDSFIKHVYSTYPIKASDRYQALNLAEMALNEKEVSANTVTSQVLQ